MIPVLSLAGLGGLFSLVVLLLLVCHDLERDTCRHLARAAPATSRDRPRRSAALASPAAPTPAASPPGPAA